MLKEITFAWLNFRLFDFEIFEFKVTLSDTNLKKNPSKLDLNPTLRIRCSRKIDFQIEF